MASDVNSSDPVAIITIRLMMSQRWASCASCATGWRRNPKPKRRRSTTKTAPPITANPRRWKASITGKSQLELRIVPPSPEFSHHVKKGSRDIAGNLLDEGFTRSFVPRPHAFSVFCLACRSGAEAGYRESVRQPAARMIIARCGLSQSNQLYAIIRPAMTMPAHTAKDRPAATLALLGGTGCKSHSATLRYTVECKTHTFKPADISSTILTRKKIFWKVLTGMAENRSIPLMTISTNPAAVHGKSCLTTSDTAARRIVTPSRRRSSITAIPRNRHKDRTWTDSMMEYAHLDSWIAILHGVFASHSQKPKRDILGASSQSAKNRIQNLEV